MDYARRRATLTDRARSEQFDGFLVINVEDSDHANLMYLTGFTGSFGVLWVGEEPWLGTDSRYTEQASAQVKDLPVREVRGSWRRWLAKSLSETPAQRIGVAGGYLSVNLLDDLQSSIPGTRLEATEDWVTELRRLKDAEEVERIAAAAQLTDEGLRWILGRIRPGMTEREVALDLEVWYRRQGAQAVAFDLIVAGGPHSSRPHHRPGDRALADGELLLFDVGVKLDDYCSDLTRTVAMGQASSHAREVYAQVLAANEAGLEAVRAGVSGTDADAAARQVLDKAGLVERFGHGLGHGLGLEVHEAPRLSPASDDTLEAGMVVTVEPGVYFPGAFGIRIEDLVVVRPDGCEVLSGFPKQELLTL